MSRPTKRTRFRIDGILVALRAGATRTEAARRVEIDPATLRRWLSRSARFCAVVERAEAEAAVLMASRVTQAASKDWRAAAWWLERRRPSEWKGARTELDSAVSSEPARAGSNWEPDRGFAEQVVLILQQAERLPKGSAAALAGALVAPVAGPIQGQTSD
jgi:hypothetical protein